MKIEKSPINENRSEQLSVSSQNPTAAGGDNRLASEAAGKLTDKIELAGGQSLLAKAKEASPMVAPERMSKLAALVADGSYEPDPQAISECLIQETEER